MTGWLNNKDFGRKKDQANTHEERPSTSYPNSSTDNWGLEEPLFMWILAVNIYHIRNYSGEFLDILVIQYKITIISLYVNKKNKLNGKHNCFSKQEKKIVRREAFFFSNMFTNLFSIWLNRRQPFLFLLLPSICCNIIHYITSGKLHCTFKRNDSEKANNFLVLSGK